MRLEPADAGRLLKRRSQLETGGFCRSRLSELRHFSLRRDVLASTATDQLFWLDGHHSSFDRLRVRGMARQFLYFRSAGAPGELSHLTKAAQNRSAEAFRIDRRTGWRIPERETTLRSLRRDGRRRVGQGKRRIDAQLYSKLSASARSGALHRWQVYDCGSARTRAWRCLYLRDGRPDERRR